MAIINTGYPSYFNINNSYAIRSLGWDITYYNGEIYQYGAKQTDISPIIRQLVSAPDYDNEFWKSLNIIQDYPVSFFIKDYDVREKMWEIKISTNDLNDNITFSNTGFSGSDLYRVYLGNQITQIGNMFQNCPNLYYVSLGNNILSISEDAFKNSDISTLYIYTPTAPQVGQDLIVPSTCRIYVPSASVTNYKNGWPQHSSQIYGMGAAENLIASNMIVYDAPNIINFKAGNVPIAYNRSLKNNFRHYYDFQYDNSYDSIDAFWNYTGEAPTTGTQYPCDAIQDYVYPFQRIIYSVIASDRTPEQQSVVITNAGSYNSVINFPTSIYNRAYCVPLDDRFPVISNAGGHPTLKPKILFKSDNITKAQYDIRLCVPDNVVTLYFINMAGGITWCHCDKKNTKSLKVTRNQITHNSVIDKPAEFGIDNFMNSTYYEYTLNTDWLDDEQMTKLQELFKSPKVWMFDYTTETMKSVILTENNYNVKTKMNQRMYNYTIKVQDSQTYNIYS